MKGKTLTLGEDIDVIIDGKMIVIRQEPAGCYSKTVVLTEENLKQMIALAKSNGLLKE
jgi:hypothetical protein